MTHLLSSTPDGSCRARNRVPSFLGAPGSTGESNGSESPSHKYTTHTHSHPPTHPQHHPPSPTHIHEHPPIASSYCTQCQREGSVAPTLTCTQRSTESSQNSTQLWLLRKVSPTYVELPPCQHCETLLLCLARPLKGPLFQHGVPACEAGVRKRLLGEGEHGGQRDWSGVRR